MQPTLTSPSSQKPPLIVGVLCGAAAALFWAAGFVAVRRGLDAGLQPADIAFHRFVWAGVLLIPLVARRSLRDFGGVGWGRALVIFVLAGPLQAAVSYTGFTLVPLAHGGVIHPGSAAMFGFALAAFVLKEAVPPRQLVGGLVIVGGLMVFAGESLHSIGGHALGGDLMFMTSGLAWATFGMLLKRWRIDGARATTVTCALAVVIFVPIHGLVVGYDSMIAAGWAENLLQVAVQGLLAGALGIYLYSRAVAILGAGRTAIFPSLVPIMTVAIGYVALGEVPTVAQVVGLTVVMLGFWLALSKSTNSAH